MAVGGIKSRVENERKCGNKSNNREQKLRPNHGANKRAPKLRTRAPAAHIIISTEDYTKQNAWSHFTICTHHLILVYFIFVNVIFFRLTSVPFFCLFASRSLAFEKAHTTMTKLLFILPCCCSNHLKCFSVDFKLGYSWACISVCFTCKTGPFHFFSRSSS